MITLQDKLARATLQRDLAFIVMPFVLGVGYMVGFFVGLYQGAHP